MQVLEQVLVLPRGEWSASRPGYIIPRKKRTRKAWWAPEPVCALATKGNRNPVQHTFLRHTESPTDLRVIERAEGRKFERESSRFLPISIHFRNCTIEDQRWLSELTQRLIKCLNIDNKQIFHMNS